MTAKLFDKIILGAGIFGLYAAKLCAAKGQKVLVLEKDSKAFSRASYINQARLHMGYHYPRSKETAKSAANYFERFASDFKPAINSGFRKIYAIAARESLTSHDKFLQFCREINIPCQPCAPQNYFKEGACDAAFITKEFTFDGNIIRDMLLDEVLQMPGINIAYNVELTELVKKNDMYQIRTQDQNTYLTPYVINTTYASVNQLLYKLGLPLFPLKYELCVIILCKTSPELKDTAITVMDGPFFSVIPFGNTGYHSLTTVSFTPHLSSYNELPVFDCQARSNGYCSKEQLGNCNPCIARPQTAWKQMHQLAKQFLHPKLKMEYKESLFAIKPILKTSEEDDSRPTLIQFASHKPTFLSVLSGKINTIYELERVL